MLLWFIPSLLGIVYCLKYWNLPSPPPNDPISPFVIVNLAYGVLLWYPPNAVTYLVSIGLLVDAAADFYMDIETMPFAMILFAGGHLIRQWGFILTFNYGYTILLFACITEIILILLITLKSGKHTLILVYSIIMGLTAISSTMSIGFLFLIVSDLIIAYELLIRTISYRPFRIVMVPLLFWIGEYITIRELLG